LLGKYYLGIQPVKAGYSEYAITPNLGGLTWMEGTVPTPKGSIHLFMDTKTIKVKASEGKGYLTFVSSTKPKASIGTFERLKDNCYRLLINTQEEVTVKYR